MPGILVNKVRVLVSIVLVALLLGSGVGVAHLLKLLAIEPARRVVETIPPLVTTLLMVPDDVVEWFDGYGSVRAIRQANLAAEVSAQVLERVDDLRAGAEVIKGQVLIRLDDRQYQYAYRRAKALADAEKASLDELVVESENLRKLMLTAKQELRLAETEKVRMTRLLEQELASKVEYDQVLLAYRQAQRILLGYQRELAKIAPRRARVQASFAGAQASAALANLDIERCVIAAPFQGQVDEVFVGTGDHVIAGRVVVSLVDRSRVELPIGLPASAYGRLEVGAVCRIESESRGDVKWFGKVARIAPQADTITRTFNVYVVIDNTQQENPLIPGMFVKASVRGPTLLNRLVVPRSACRNGSVWVVSGSTARRKRVSIVRRIKDRAVVTGELAPGDQVIVSHLDRLEEGTAIRIDPALSQASHTQTLGSGN